MDDVQFEERIAIAVEKRLTPLLRKLEEALEQSSQEWFSITRAAKWTGLSAKHIRRAIKHGELLCSDAALEGAARPTYRIARSHLTAWLERKQLKQGPAKSARQAQVDEFFPKRGRRKGGRVA
jgi:hypothetical protein